MIISVIEENVYEALYKGERTLELLLKNSYLAMLETIFLYFEISKMFVYLYRA